MKRRLFIVSIIFLCLWLSFGSMVSLAMAQETKQEEKKIITTGEAKIWIEPDRARVFLGIETLGGTVEVARQENATKIKGVMEALKSLNIKDMLIKAPSYNVSLVKESEYDATRVGHLPKIIGYKVIQDFTVLLESKDTLILSNNAGLVIDTALNNGVNIILNIDFFKEDDSQDRRNVMALAVKDAISNAKIIAEAAGVAVKDYTLINSSMGYWQPRVMAQMHQAFAPAEAGGIATTLVAGKIAVACNVQLQCTIE